MNDATSNRRPGDDATPQPHRGITPPDLSPAILLDSAAPHAAQVDADVWFPTDDHGSYAVVTVAQLRHTAADCAAAADWLDELLRHVDGGAG